MLPNSSLAVHKSASPSCETWYGIGLVHKSCRSFIQPSVALRSTRPAEFTINRSADFGQQGPRLQTCEKHTKTWTNNECTKEYSKAQCDHRQTTRFSTRASKWPARPRRAIRSHRRLSQGVQDHISARLFAESKCSLCECAK